MTGLLGLFEVGKLAAPFTSSAQPAGMHQQAMSPTRAGQYGTPQGSMPHETMVTGRASGRLGQSEDYDVEDVSYPVRLDTDLLFATMVLCIG